MPSRIRTGAMEKPMNIRTLNKYNLSGLPYEMVINSNPCIAYLMKDNSLLLQIRRYHVYAQ